MNLSVFSLTEGIIRKHLLCILDIPSASLVAYIKYMPVNGDIYAL